MIRENSVSSKTLDLFIFFFTGFVFIITLYPVLHLMALSLSGSMAISRNEVSFYPVGLTIQAYWMILEAGTVPRAFLNSVLYTTVGTADNMIFTTTMAYAISKKRLPFRGFFMTFILITMYLSGGLIPAFLLVKSLGMYNTMWALIIPGAISTYNLIILHSFFRTLPEELEESAHLDGANDIVVFLRIVLPISKAAIATITLFYMVNHWNSFFSALIYLKSAAKFPLQLILRQIVLAGQMAAELASQGSAAAAEDNSSNAVDIDSIKYATLFISIIPMMILYPFIQKYFVKGVMIGSLKG